MGHDDPASHAYLGRRHAGNQSLYGPPASWYVYRSYGIHWCANLVVRGPAGGAAVLIRALAPVSGAGLMQARRGNVPSRHLTTGPGKLTQALGITRELDGAPMRDSPVMVGEMTKRPAPEILVTPRIGITKAQDWPLRFLLKDLPNP